MVSAADMTMQIALCEGCIPGHCFVVNESGTDIVYCGPIEGSNRGKLKDRIVEEGSTVYMNKIDFDRLIEIKKRGEGNA